jgi:uncharacterized membrane protein YtjA (UPF0391 family)
MQFIWDLFTLNAISLADIDGFFMFLTNWFLIDYGVIHTLAGILRCRRQRKSHEAMLSWTLIYLVLAAIAGLLGFTGVAGAAGIISQILFVLFIVMMIATAVSDGLRDNAR